MLPQSFIVVSLIINSLSGLSYLKETWLGRAAPHRVTWFLWTLAPFITFAAQISAGVTWPATITFLSFFFPLLILMASFRGKAQTWVITTSDYLCGMLSLLALVAWGLTKNPFYAVLLSILADAMASWPTLKKAYTHPESEDGVAYILGLVGTAFSFFTFTDFSFLALSFPLYMVLLCAVLSALIYRKRLLAFFKR